MNNTSDKGSIVTIESGKSILSKEMYKALLQLEENNFPPDRKRVLEILANGGTVRDASIELNLKTDMVERFKTSALKNLQMALEQIEEDGKEDITNECEDLADESVIYVTNWFKLHSMFDEQSFDLFVDTLELDEVENLTKGKKLISRIGSLVMCRVYSRLLGVKLEPYPGFFKFKSGDKILFIHYSGRLLLPDAEFLPDDSQVKFSYIEISGPQFEEGE